jgi:molybdopterin-guanine dinucleotide biosynthesis protein B
MMKRHAIPYVGFAAGSGTGKTTLLVRLVSIFNARGIRTAVIKHSHHAFNIDLPGKDSYEFRQAGARQVLIGANRQWALMVDTDEEHTLDDYLGFLKHEALDLVLVEGFKHLPFPKIEIYRPVLGRPLLAENDDTIIAIATDDSSGIDSELPILDLNNPEQVANFVIDRSLQVKN